MARQNLARSSDILDVEEMGTDIKHWLPANGGVVCIIFFYNSKKLF